MAGTRRRKFAAWACFALLALIAELSGRSITLRIDRAFQLKPLAAPSTNYYPFLLAGVKVLSACALAALAWRILRAHVTASAGEQLLGAIDRRTRWRAARQVSFTLSVKLWGGVFAAMALWYLLQTEAEPLGAGHAPSLDPWLHTYALSVFAVLAVPVAVAWGVVSRWLAATDEIIAVSRAFAQRLLRPVDEPVPRTRPTSDCGPRGLFGLAFESRPPPQLI